MSYNVQTGEIIPDRLYLVNGDTITYNENTIAADTMFRGVAGVAAFTGDGTVTEVPELRGVALSQLQTAADQPVFPDKLELNGAGVLFEQTQEERVFNDITVLRGLAIEFVDTAGYIFQITETRL